MDDEMYGSDEGAGEAGPGPAQDPDMKSDEMEDKGETTDEKTEDEGAGESAMLPKSILAGKHFDPGDEVVLKVVAIHGDEVEVEYRFPAPRTTPARRRVAPWTMAPHAAMPTRALASGWVR